MTSPQRFALLRAPAAPGLAMPSPQRFALLRAPAAPGLAMRAGPGPAALAVAVLACVRAGAARADDAAPPVFVQDDSGASGPATVLPGRPAAGGGRVDSVAGEVIVIRGRVKPPAPPRPTNHAPSKAPPYSERAILSDAWTKAWMLLELDEAGKLRRFKFLKRPGYDLEQIAVSEIRKLRFEPARDASGKPMRSLLVWPIEWPSAWWLSDFTGTRSAMPEVRGFPPRRQDAGVPCAGSGPWLAGSVHPVYKDCSKPDLAKAAGEPWILP